MFLALYKGPTTTLEHAVIHYGIRARTFSKYSHAELVIDGICYSSSTRDKGVRSKIINLSSGRWDIYWLTDDPALKQKALEWFAEHDGEPYDYRSILNFVLPVGHNTRHWMCFEAIGSALGIPNAHKLTADSLLRAAHELTDRINPYMQEIT